MKSTKFLLCVVLIAPLAVVAQPETNKWINYYPFQKNSWGFPLQRYIDLERYTDFDDDGTKLGHGTDFNLSFDKTYFLARNLGLSLDYCLDWWCEGDDYSGRDWTGKLGVVYGTRLTDHLNLYGEIGGIYGRNREEQGNNVDKYSSSGFYVEAGLPIHLDNSVFFTPKINWSSVTYNYDDGKEVRNGFGFAAGLESYMGFNDVMCDHHKGFSLSKDKYTHGNSYFNFQTMGNLRFGNSETTYDNSPLTSEYDFTNVRVGLNYRNYIADNFALGAKLNYRSRSQEGQNNENTTSSFSFSPRATYNLPLKNGWNNWFFEGGVGFGSSKNEFQVGTIINEIKYSNFNYGIWTGYNFFFSERLALTAQIGHKWATQKNTDTDVKTETRSLNLEIGTQYNFRF